MKLSPLRTILNLVIAFLLIGTSVSYGGEEEQSDRGLSWEDVVRKTEESENDHIREILEDPKHFLEEVAITIKRQRKIFLDIYPGHEDLFVIYLLACMNKENILIYGPPGGSKTAMSKFFAQANDKDPFILQMLSTTLSDTFVGGLVFEDIKSGRYTRNLAPIYHKVVAFVDEVNHGRDDVFSDIFQVLSKEVLNGEQYYDLKVRSIIMTGNSTMDTLVQRISRDSDMETGRAFADRTIFEVPISGKSDADLFARNFLMYQKNGFKKCERSLFTPISQNNFSALEALANEYITDKKLAINVFNFLKSFQLSCNNDAQISGRKKRGKFVSYHTFDNDRIMAKVTKIVTSYLFLMKLMNAKNIAVGTPMFYKSLKPSKSDLPLIANALRLVLLPESIDKENIDKSKYTHIFEETLKDIFPGDRDCFSLWKCCKAKEYMGYDQDEDEDEDDQTPWFVF